MRLSLRPRVAVSMLAPALLALAAGCERARRDDAEHDVRPAGREASSDRMRFESIGAVADPALISSSGLAASGVEPGLLWSMNDDGDPVLYAVGADGSARGRVRLRDARDRDWEAIAAGPCDSTGTARCLYVGDVGDNGARHGTSTIYRLPEPRAAGGRFPAKVDAERLDFRYDVGPHDVEAMYVARDASIWLVSKRPLRRPDGTVRPALLHHLPASAWREAQPVLARVADSLPQLVPTSILAQVTDAALSPQGDLLAVRTYEALHLFAADPRTGRPQGPRLRRCPLEALGEAQGEGIAWERESGTFLLSSEGGDESRGIASTLGRVTCPVPR